MMSTSTNPIRIVLDALTEAQNQVAEGNLEKVERALINPGVIHAMFELRAVQLLSNSGASKPTPNLTVVSTQDES